MLDSIIKTIQSTDIGALERICSENPAELKKILDDPISLQAIRIAITNLAKSKPFACHHFAAFFGLHDAAVGASPHFAADSLLNLAAKNGHFDTVKWYHEKHQNQIPIQSVARIAVKYNNHELLEWCLHRKSDKALNINELAEIGAENGNLESIQLCFKNGANNIEKVAKKATMHGHLNVIQWCVETDKDKTQIDVQELAEVAARAGHANVVAWCFKNGATNIKNIAMIAGRHGHTDVAKYCFENGFDDIKQVMRYAVTNIQTAFIDWGIKTYPEKIKADELAEYAAENGNTFALIHFIDKHKQPILGLLNIAVKHDKAETANELFEHYKDEVTPAQLADYALQYINSEKVVHLCIETKNFNAQNCALTAAAFGNLNIVRLCFEKGVTDKQAVINRAAQFGHVDIVEWGFANGAKDVQKIAEAALRKGSINIIRWCFNNHEDKINISALKDTVNITSVKFNKHEAEQVLKAIVYINSWQDLRSFRRTAIVTPIVGLIASGLAASLSSTAFPYIAAASVVLSIGFGARYGIKNHKLHHHKAMEIESI